MTQDADFGCNVCSRFWMHPINELDNFNFKRLHMEYIHEILSPIFASVSNTPIKRKARTNVTKSTPPTQQSNSSDEDGLVKCIPLSPLSSGGKQKELNMKSTIT